ncbi:MAG: ribosomal-protein-alanine N-acetyltransferase [Ruminococcaceae bacterium]|nr:ribosomal-protein-alanine N-acetyltransferase [Oscillospiraceae bacterium]
MYYEIVPMDRSHIGQIAELERNCFSTPWTENMLTDALFDPQASFIVAEDGEGNILGYAGLHAVLDEGYIDNVAVEEAARRHGVASALLDVFCRFGEVNLAFLTLEVRASNAAAIALYQKHGFEQVGLRKNYYTNPREDAIIMTREFTSDGTEAAE